MNALDKEKFIRSLCDSTRDKMIAAIPHMPDEWDGIELRQYATDQMAQGAGSFIRQRDSRKRYQSYRSDVATRFGL